MFCGRFFFERTRNFTVIFTYGTLLILYNFVENECFS